jgi:hypothetical protein
MRGFRKLTAYEKYVEQKLIYPNKSFATRN